MAVLRNLGVVVARCEVKGVIIGRDRRRRFKIGEYERVVLNRRWIIDVRNAFAPVIFLLPGAM